MKGEAKKQELRDRITKAGIELIKSEGFDAASMEEIARRAGITQRTLCKYFPVKEAVIGEFIRRTLSRSQNLRVER